MAVDPLSLFLEATIGLELKLISQLKFKDFLLLHKFNWHIKHGAPPEIILDDISKIKSQVIFAINNSDEKEKDAWICLLLSKMDLIGDVERFAICYSVEEIIINYSKFPNFVESGIFMIYAWFSKYYEDWEKKYPQVYPENEFLVFKDMKYITSPAKDCVEKFDNESNLKRMMEDISFLSAWACAQMIYRCCLNMAELSRENLIRVGNHLSNFSAGEPISAFRKNVIFDIIYLEIIIQIAAKAKARQIEPMHSKLKLIISKAIPGRLREAFKTLDGAEENNIAKMGNLDVFLATPKEIQIFKDEIIVENFALKKELI